jgi:ribonuclease HI
VKKDLESQRKKDLQSFGGLFDRGTIYCPTESPGAPPPLEASSSSASASVSGTEPETMSVGEALEKIKDMESAAKTFYRDGKILESQELEEKAQSLKKEIQEYQATTTIKKSKDDWLQIDYSNPSQETIEAAAKMGLDLNDPR